MKPTRAQAASSYGWGPSFRSLGILATVFGLIFLLSGCDAEIKDKVSGSTSGAADDGNAATPPAQYTPADTPPQATDAGTNASSITPSSDQVGGVAHAVLAPGSKSIAEARSYNRLLTQLVVNKQSAFTFDIVFDVQGIQLQGRGWIDLVVHANVLDANGQTIPNAAITSTDFRMDLDANGNRQVIIANDTANPDHLNGNNYTRTLSGPNRGINLLPGNYTIELELRITAHAPVDPHSQADVNSATATIKLR